MSEKKVPFMVIVLLLNVLLLIVCTSSTNEHSSNLEGPYLGQELPGITSEIFAPGIISLGFHENGIIFSPDGKEIFYSMSDSQYSSKTFVQM